MTRLSYNYLNVVLSVHQKNWWYCTFIFFSTILELISHAVLVSPLFMFTFHIVATVNEARHLSYLWILCNPVPKKYFWKCHSMYHQFPLDLQEHVSKWTEVSLFLCTLNFYCCTIYLSIILRLGFCFCKCMKFMHTERVLILKWRSHCQLVIWEKNVLTPFSSLCCIPIIISKHSTGFYMCQYERTGINFCSTASIPLNCTLCCLLFKALISGQWHRPILSSICSTVLPVVPPIVALTSIACSHSISVIN